MLKKILEYKQLELEHQKRRVSLKDIEKKACDTESAIDFLGCFKSKDINIIAEYKRASPSTGLIEPKRNLEYVVKSYEAGGMKALSILTDEHFFKGSTQDLLAAKKFTSLPVLRKDFTLNEYHIFEARAYGADAILLIVSALDDFQIKDYKALANELGMKTIIEVHDEPECERIILLNINFDIIGINNRNLKTLKTNTLTTERLLEKVKGLGVIISESGLSNHDILMKLKENDVSGFLIGTAFLKEKNMSQKINEMMGRLCQ